MPLWSSFLFSFSLSLAIWCTSSSERGSSCSLWRDGLVITLQEVSLKYVSKRKESDFAIYQDIIFAAGSWQQLCWPFLHRHNECRGVWVLPGCWSFLQISPASWRAFLPCWNPSAGEWTSGWVGGFVSHLWMCRLLFLFWGHCSSWSQCYLQHRSPAWDFYVGRRYKRLPFTCLLSSHFFSVARSRIWQPSDSSPDLTKNVTTETVDGKWEFWPTCLLPLSADTHSSLACTVSNSYECSGASSKADNFVAQSAEAYLHIARSCLSFSLQKKRNDDQRPSWIERLFPLPPDPASAFTYMGSMTEQSSNIIDCTRLRMGYHHLFGTSPLCTHVHM